MTASLDPKYDRFRDRLKSQLPHFNDRDVGDAWMRCSSEGAPFKHRPGTVSVGVGLDASTNYASIAPSGIPSCIEYWAAELALKPDLEPVLLTKSFLVEALAGRHQVDSKVGGLVACATLWLGTRGEVGQRLLPLLLFGDAMMELQIVSTGPQRFSFIWGLDAATDATLNNSTVNADG